MNDRLYSRAKRPGKRSSAEVAGIRILVYLASNSGEDAVGFTQHHLMGIRGLPAQNWTRFRAILDHLVRVGLLERNMSSGFALFRISQRGEELVDKGLGRLDRYYIMSE